jgi:glycosyltransferase involved in cell wall biosynthesis
VNPEVSIILISHNKFPQNKFALYSLEKQTFSPAKMEVILVDDCSTDQTVSLKHYTAPFRFKYLRSNTNLGRSGTKNLGVREAEGEIVIFLDGEVMVDPDFVANHWRHYHTAEKIAVSGNASQYSTFSVLCPGFSKEQIKRLHSLAWSKPFLIKRLSKRLWVSTERIMDFSEFWQYARKNKRPIPLFTKEDLDDRLFKQLSFLAPYFPPQIMEKYGTHLTGFYLAWTFFITRNVSTRKSFLEEVGLFNEEFKGWGSEDWEMGFRLYKNSVKIIEDPEIVSYHQEHPFSKENRREDQMLNYAKFTTLHPEVEVCVVTLGILGKRGFLENNEIVADYYHLNNDFPHKFTYSKNAFIKLTQQIPLLMGEGKQVARLWQQAGLENEPDKKKMLLNELSSLRKMGKYDHFVSALDLLLAL